MGAGGPGGKGGAPDRVVPVAVGQVAQKDVPLVMEGRGLDQPVAATRVARGTDVNFGALTQQLLAGVEVRRGEQVRALERTAGGWRLRSSGGVYEAPFVFLGAGGGRLVPGSGPRRPACHPRKWSAGRAV